jgi:environmental stress-induced protein Ves
LDHQAPAEVGGRHFDWRISQIETGRTVAPFFPHQHRITMYPLQGEGIAEGLNAEDSLSARSEGCSRRREGSDDINHDNDSRHKRPIS